MSKLTEYREKQNLTQEELSKKSGISVRTIQRIESGIDPKGFTLKALAKTLNIDEINLIKQKPLITESSQKWVKIINLSSLLVVFIPVLNFAIPLIIALSKKQLNVLTKQIITIQILWTLLWLTIFLLGNIINLGELGRDIVIAIMVILVLANAFIILRNSAEINKNNQLFYSPKFSII
ncbi:helix-turn-helix domain-containing protein [Flagellimonas okinawensis]|uniref:Helix-turn-helix domain-containing protein n=1 Tax=Flagellimonas okinawensis TaxID=3031324 RepID=A0ABT5XRG0_9FLAO|nr:helix-turn-helix domain-containing protein [[Muricauda] okinawensis]MDF0708488.1 helix-turn-helix domain-containing protein [[Muricauda] okinawensis]